MDKYEYKLKLDQMKSLTAAHDYKTAAEIADSINWHKIKNVNALMKAAEIYEMTGRYEESKEILLMAYDRSPIGRMIVYRLAEVAVKMKNFDDAKEYYQEFVEVAPHDNLKYVLRYEISKAEGADNAALIAILEELKEQEYSEEWAYELACLYHKAGMNEKCIEACDELILWFGDGPYVERALELKMVYQPLTKQQEEKYRQLRQGSDGFVEVRPEDDLDSGEIVSEPVQIPKVRIPAERFNTQNLQEELQKSMRQIMAATEKEDVDSGMDTIKKLVEDIPYLQLPKEEPEKELAAESAHIPTDQEIDYTLKHHFKEYLAEDIDGQMSMFVPEDIEDEPQPGGQMSIEGALRGWEKTKRAAEAALWEADRRKLESAKARALQEAGDIMERLVDAIPKLDSGLTPQQLLVEEYLGGKEIEDDRAAEMVASMNQILQREIDRLSTENAQIDERIAAAAGNIGGVMEPDESVSDEREPAGYDGLPEMGTSLGYGGMPGAQEEPDYGAVPGYEQEPEPETGYESFSGARGTSDYGSMAGPGAGVNFESVPGRGVVPGYGGMPVEENVPDYEGMPGQEVMSGYEDMPVEENISGYEGMSGQEVMPGYEGMPVEENVPGYEGMPGQEMMPGYENMPVEENISGYEGMPGQEMMPGYEHMPGYGGTLKQGVIPEYGMTPGAEAMPDYGNISGQEPVYREENVPGYREMSYWEEGAGHEWIPEDTLPEIAVPEDLRVPGGEGFVAGEPEQSFLQRTGRFSTMQPEELEETFLKETAQAMREDVNKGLTGGDLSGRAGSGGMRGRRNVHETLPEIAEPVEEDAYPAITKLSKEQREIFTYFVQIRGMEQQLCQALTGASRHLMREENAGTGNLIVLGDQGSGKTMLARNVIKALQLETGKLNGRSGKLEASALNGKDLVSVLKQVAGGCLIIEKAGELKRETAIRLSQLLRSDESGLFVIMEDTHQGIRAALSRDAGFAAGFTEKVNIPIFTSDELVSFAKSYANELGYTIDEMGVLALYNSISSIQKLDRATTLAEVKEIVDEAIVRVERGVFKKAFSIITSRRYDDEDYVVLHEKDFVF